MGTVRISVKETSPSTTFQVEGDLLSQSVSGNYSVVRCYLVAKNGPGGTTGSYFGGSGYQAGTIVGVKEFARKSGDPFLPSGYSDNATRWRLGPYDVQVPHNADGTRAAIQFGMVLSYSAGAGTHFSGTLALPTIPRASTSSLPTNTTIGTTATINTNRASTSFTHTLELWEYGSSATSPVSTLATGVGASYSWAVPTSLASMLPNVTTKKFFIRTKTYSGGSLIGSKDTVFNLVIPASMVPIISSITATDANTAVATAIGGFVQGQSILKGVVNVTAPEGATIASSSFSVDGNSASSGGQVPLMTPGTRAIAASALDSRGRSGTGSGSVTVLAYEPPKILDYLVERSTSGNVASPSGTYLRMTLNASATGLTVASTQKNSLTITVKTRVRGTTNWTTRNVINAALTYNSTVLITGGAIAAQTTAYEVLVEVKDKLQTTSDVYTISTAGAIIDVDATRQAFGMLLDPAGPATQISGPGRLYGTWSVDGTLAAEGLDLGAGNLAAGAVDVATNINSSTIRATSGGDASLTSTDHAIQAGPTDGLNIILDGNEIMSRNNGAAGELNIQIDGGNINIGQTGGDRVLIRPRVDNPFLPWAVSAGVASSITASFPTVTMASGRFTVPPIVVAQLNSGAGADIGVGVMVTNVTTTSFQCRHTASSGTKSVYWMAVQMTSGAANG